MALSKQTSDLGASARYQGLLLSISEVLIDGRRHAAKSLNAVLTRTYWSIGQHLVEYEQGGKERAAYGAELLKQLSRDLQARLGRGFSEKNPGANAAVLSAVENFADAVCGFRYGTIPRDFADSVCEIEATGCARFSAVLVALCAFAFRRRFGGETSL